MYAKFRYIYAYGRIERSLKVLCVQKKQEGGVNIHAWTPSLSVETSRRRWGFLPRSAYKPCAAAWELFMCLHQVFWVTMSDSVSRESLAALNEVAANTRLLFTADDEVDKLTEVSNSLQNVEIQRNKELDSQRDMLKSRPQPWNQKELISLLCKPLQDNLKPKNLLLRDHLTYLPKNNISSLSTR